MAKTNNAPPEHGGSRKYSVMRRWQGSGSSKSALECRKKVHGALSQVFTPARRLCTMFVTVRSGLVCTVYVKAHRRFGQGAQTVWTMCKETAQSTASDHIFVHRGAASVWGRETADEAAHSRLGAPALPSSQTGAGATWWAASPPAGAHPRPAVQAARLQLPHLLLPAPRWGSHKRRIVLTDMSFCTHKHSPLPPS